MNSLRRGRKRSRRLSIHSYITGKIRSGEKLHFTLVDPDKPLRDLRKVAEEMKEAGTDAFLIGGSLGVTPKEAGEAAEVLKETGLPIIVFPGNINCLTPKADAVLFIVLLNTLDPYYLIGAQLAGAPLIKKYRLEPLPTGYLVIYGSTAVAHVGRVIPLPVNKPEVAGAYSLAAEMMGLKYLYIEGGSGAPQPVPPQVVMAARRASDKLIIIAGGGIRDPDTARSIAMAGADIVVTGTIVEKSPEQARRIIRALKKGISS